MMLLVLCSSFVLQAQSENVALGSNFKFRDGIFLDFEQFQQNQPGFTWGEVVNNMISTKPGVVKVASLLVGDARDHEALSLDSVWGLSKNGVPYVRIPQDTSDSRQFATFVAMRMVGKICLYSYEREEEKEVVFKAYNPLTGHPFREGTVIQKDMVTKEKIMYFPSGETVNLNPATLSAWIRDDVELYEAFDSLGPRPTKEEVYQTILMYNDRNRIYTFR